MIRISGIFAIYKLLGLNSCGHLDNFNTGSYISVHYYAAVSQPKPLQPIKISSEIRSGRSTASVRMTLLGVQGLQWTQTAMSRDSKLPLVRMFRINTFQTKLHVSIKHDKTFC